jgi:hypothetical protein
MTRLKIVYVVNLEQSVCRVNDIEVLDHFANPLSRVHIDDDSKAAEVKSGLSSSISSFRARAFPVWAVFRDYFILPSIPPTCFQ